MCMNYHNVICEVENYAGPHTHDGNYTVKIVEKELYVLYHMFAVNLLGRVQISFTDIFKTCFYCEILLSCLLGMYRILWGSIPFGGTFLFRKIHAFIV